MEPPFVIRVFLVWWGYRVIYIERILEPLGCTLYSSLIIVISLQLRGCMQIAEPHKYCFVRVIVFLWRVFSLIFVSHELGILFNSLQFWFHNRHVNQDI